MCPELGTPLANVSKRNLFSSVFALLFGANVTLNGTERLFERPLDVYEEIFKKQNIFYNKTKKYATYVAYFLDIMQFYYRFISIQFLVGLIATQLANLVLEHRKLLEEVMYGLFAILVHWRLAVE